MKCGIAQVLAIFMTLTLCSCGLGNSSKEGQLDTKEGPHGSVSTSENSTTEDSGSQNPEELGNSSHAGSRSNPYSFDDEIVIETKARYEDYHVTYTLNLDELWSGTKVSSEYSSYRIEDRILVRGTIEVECEDTDDEIDFGLNAMFVTSSLNEESASIQDYKKNELNNQLHTVYSGGVYDIIIFGKDDGIGSMDISFLKISYTDVSGQSKNIWVSLPERVEDESGANSEQPSLPTENSTLQEDNFTGTTPAEPQVELTSEELETVLLEQPMYVESTKYVVQDEHYKALYPDMLQAIIRNNSGTDVKTALVAFVAWDSNGFPIKIFSSGVDIHGAYVKQVDYGDVNMTDGSSYGSNSGYSINCEKSSISTFKAIVVSYTDFDGNTWSNPYFDTWVSMFADKKLN